jgi:hypothetical protein
LQLKRDDDAVTDSLNLNVFKSVASEPGLPCGKLSQGYTDVKAIAPTESFVIIKSPI